MNLSTIVRKQIEADERRGFTVKFETDTSRHDQLVRELIGLMGEVGEFANMLKKVGLGLSINNYNGPTLSEASDNLREELADAVIYIIRLSAILEGDLEADILEKMKANDKRYQNLER